MTSMFGQLIYVKQHPFVHLFQDLAQLIGLNETKSANPNCFKPLGRQNQ